jgi:hypothetical protein
MERKKEKHMCRENLAIGLVTIPLRVERHASNSAKRRQGTVAKPLAILFIFVTALAAPAVDPSREQVIKIVEQIQRADYEGDRAALKRLYEELTPVAQSTNLPPVCHLGEDLRCGAGL